MAKLPSPQIPTSDSGISTLVDDVRHRAHDTLLSMGYTNAQVVELFASGPDFSLPAPLGMQSLSRNFRWQQRRVSETLDFASQCEQACHEHRWEDAIRAAYFMGVSESGLFMKEIELAPRREGGRKRVKERNSVWPKILEAADHISASSKQKHSVKSLHAAVMKIPDMPKREINAFRERWKAHLRKKDSK